MINFRLAVGKANCGKTAWAVQECMAQSDTLEPVIVLLPSQVNIRDFKQRMLQESRFQGQVNIHFHTFYSFIKMVADRAGFHFIELTKAQQRILLEAFLQSRKTEYTAITGRTLTSGFYSAILEYFADLEDGAFTTDLVGRILSQLSMESGSRMLIELHKLYITFTNHLESGGYLSRERLFVKVYKYLQSAPRQLKKYRLIMDGFYDFNPVQQRILEVLLPGLHSAHVTLLTGDEDVFQYAAEATEWLHQLANDLNAEVEQLEQKQPLLPAIDKLFSTDTSGNLNEAISYLEATNIALEIQHTIREVKQDVISGSYSPDEIAIMFRGGEEYNHRLRELCYKEQIPVAEDRDLPLITNPAISALLAWYDVLDGDFNRDDLVDWLQSGYINPADISSARLQRLSRKAQILEGRDQWLPRLNAALQSLQDQPENESNQREQREIQQFTELIPQVENLLKQLPDQGNKSWKAQIADLRKVRRIVRFLENTDEIEGEFAARDIRAMDSLLDVLTRLEQLAEEFNFPSLTTREFADELRRILQDTRYTAEEGCSPGITIATVPATRGMHWKKVYMIGLLDEVFPVRWRGHPLVKYNERVLINNLVKGEAKVAEQGAELQEERLLFYLALTRGLETTTVSTITGSEELLPSPFYEELRRFYQVNTDSPTVQKIDHQSKVRHPWLQSDLLQHLAGMKNSNEEFPYLNLDHFHQLIQVRELRTGLHFSEYDGHIRNPDLVEKIQSQFFQSDSAISASALEIYYESHFRFFCRYILGLKEIEEVTDELSPADRGLILHTIMERFYASLPHEFGGKVTLANLESSRKFHQKVLGEVYNEQEKKGLPIPDLLWKREKRVMGQYTWNAIRFFAGNSPWSKSDMKPDAFEFSFGTNSDDYPPLEILLDDTTLKIRGRADRLDLNSETGEFTIVDYKTSGGKKQADFANGTALQLPIYSMAAEKMLDEYQDPVQIAYYSFKQAKQDGYRRFKSTDEYQQLKARTIELIDQAIFQISSGEFHPEEGLCSRYCAYQHICRCDENRIKRKSG